MKRRLYLYLFREMLGPCAVSVLVFTCILLLGKILQLTEMVMTRGVSIGSVLYLIAAILPFVFVFTLPMSSLLSVLLAFLRLSADNEITAMKNAGVSLYQMLPPVLVFAGGLYIITTAISFYALPWGNHAFKSKLIEIARTRADIAIKESVFNNAFDKVVIYIKHYTPQSRLMEDVLISDERDPETKNTIIAPRGYLLNNPDERSVTLALLEGIISRVGRNFEVTQTVAFQRYDLNLELKELGQLSQRKKKGKEMYLSEMLENLKSLPPDQPRYKAILIELHKKFVFPFSCLVMGLLGLPLGLQTTSRRRSAGVILGLVIFLSYYMILSVTLNMGELEHFPVTLGMWTPNILFSFLAVYMLAKSARESPIAAVEKINYLAGYVSAKIKTVLKIQ